MNTTGRRADRGVLLFLGIGASFLVGGCRAPSTTGEASPPQGSQVAPAAPESRRTATTAEWISQLRERLAVSAPPGEHGGVSAARVVLPARSSGAVRVEDVASGMALEVTLNDAGDVEGEAADGYVLYRAAHASGAALVQHVIPSGDEDFLSFDAKPADTRVSYRVTLARGVAGLRLVGSTLEMLDASGAPRLRVAPPFVVGSDGARTEASLRVAGCVVDESPGAPWGRRVFAPGSAACTIDVAWPGEGIAYPAVLDPAWTTTGSMATARQAHTATVLPTGRVLVAGGTSGATALASAELYDRGTGTWAATGSMAGARQLHTAVLLGAGSNATTSGKVLVAGGRSGSTTLSTAQLYAPSTGTWSAAANLDAPREQHTATLLPSGRVLVAGGAQGDSVLSSASTYSPSLGSGAWTATMGPLPSAVKAHTASLLVTSNPQLNGKVLVAGGDNGSSTLSGVYLFDPAQSAFSTLAALPGPREGQTATSLASGKVLLAGGRDGSATLRTTVLFDPGFGPGSWAAAGSMTVARQAHTATLLPGGQVLVAGGSSGTATLASAELFDGTSAWAATVTLPAPVQGQTASLLSNGLVLLAGGSDGAAAVSAARLYDASSGGTCTTNAQCGAGFCVAGVCCNTACADACSSCALPGSVGTCAPRPDGTACSDGSACTQSDTCQGGACTGGTPVTCGASDACHVAGTCDPATGACSNPPAADGTACSDGSACTLADSCLGGACVGGAVVTCAASDACHAAGACDPGTGLCSNPIAANGTSCSDGNACTQSDSCQNGTCTGSNPVTCGASDSCHLAGTCNPATGACSNPPAGNGIPCDDGNACTLTDTCQSGACVGNVPVTCTASDACHVAGTCNPASGTCSNPVAANGTSCSDGNACTQSDSCQNGTCGGTPIVCTASDACHVAGTCDSSTGTCSNPVAANGTSCSDGNACTQSDICQNGACTAGTPVVCTASDTCHVAGTCDPSTGACSNPAAANGAPCNDNSACTQSDSCQSGACVGSNPVVCTASDTCHLAGICNPRSGSCSNPIAPNGTSCSDGNACTVHDTCSTGSCVAGAPLTCAASDACHVAGTCSPATGTCSNPIAANGTLCDDGNACTQGDSCQSGACAGGNPVTCSASDACHAAGTCDPGSGTCSNPAIPNCDGTPTTGDNPFETRASVLGRVQTFAGAPVAGFTVTLFDVPVAGPPRSDVSATVAGDGSFRARLTGFPDVEPARARPHHVMVVIDAAGYIEAQREAYLHPGDAVDVGVIDVVAPDPNVTTLGPAGGVATDSQGLVELDVPPGALGEPTPIVITPIQSREEMPATLPDATVTGYGFEIDPKGTRLASPATVRVKNYRNFPTTLTLPAGRFDEVQGGWKHVDTATWDGSAWTYAIQHFSPEEVNPGAYGEWLVRVAPGPDPNMSDTIFAGSAIGVTGGSVRERVALPTYRHSGRDYGVTLHYSSGLAGNDALGSAPIATSQAVPASAVAVALRGTVATGMCVPLANAGVILAGAPGSCAPGSCSLSASQTEPTSWTIGGSLWGNGLSGPVALPQGASAMAAGAWVPLPLLSDGTLPSEGFVTERATLAVTAQSGQTCASGGGAFGSPAASPLLPVPSSAGPALTMDQRVFVHHRHNSSFGPGWAVENVDRVYREPSGDHAVLVRGTGEEEDFRPGASITSLLAASGAAPGPLAHDASTGESFAATADGQILRIEPDGSPAPLFAGLAFDGPPQSMAITYVAGQRDFLVALTSRLVLVDGGGAVASIFTRPGTDAPTHWPSQVAAREDLAFYTDGTLASPASTPVLYRFRLTDSPPTAEAVSLASGPDLGLDPGVTLDAFLFRQPGGLAFAPTGELYVADAGRNAVYEVALDADGEVGPSSAVARVVGDGAGRYVPPVGQAFPAALFPIDQPFCLSTAADGTLLMLSGYGAAAFDPQALEAEWLVLGGQVPGGDLSYSLASSFRSYPFASIAATGPRSFLFARANDAGLADASALVSEYDPTRTLTFRGGAGMLVDTTAGVIESFDAQGRLMQKNLRTGEPIAAVTYADATSDRVQSISDNDGNVTTLVYDPGSLKLETLTDPSGRVVTFTHDGFGDLRSITRPDGETETFAYEAHHMKTKTTRGGDATTTYAYNADGTLQSVTQPAGEVTTVVASLSRPPSYDARNQLTRSGTYADAHGVSHAFVTNASGRIESDSYTADGVAFTKSLAYAAQLDPAPGEGVPRQNTHGWVAETRLNGVPLALTRDYDDFGRVVRERMGGGFLVRAYAYDASGLLASVSLGSDATQTIARDAAGHVTRVFDTLDGSTPTGREIDFTWRTDAQPATIVQHGVTYALSYDDSGPATRNVTAIADTLGRSSSFTYDASGNIASASDGASTRSFSYDADNRLVTATDALGHQTVLGYTQAGCACSDDAEIASVHTPDLAAGAGWTMTYGAEGRLSSVTDPSGFFELYAYEPTGELSAVQDRDGNLTSLTHDRSGRTLTVVDALGRAHRRAYAVPVPASPPATGGWAGATLLGGGAGVTGASTDVTAALDPGDYQVGLSVVPLYGYPAQVSFYRDATFELAYAELRDEAARVVLRRDRAGQPIASTDLSSFASHFYDESTTYDGDTTAPVVVARSTPLLDAQFSYTPDFDRTSASGDGSASDGETQYTFERDVGGRLTAVRRRFAYDSAFDGPSQTYGYGPGGKLQQYAGPDGTKTYVYDVRGLLQSMTVVLGAQSETWTFDYDALGRSAHVTFPDGHVREQTYDPEGRIASRCYEDAGQSECYTATYDGAGNPSTTVDPYGGSDAYQYDALNRLVKVTHSVGGATAVIETYGYNAIGALHTGFDAGGMAALTYDDQRPRVGGGGSADAAIPHTLSGQPVSLDAGGRVTGLLGATVGYDFRDGVRTTGYTTAAGDAVEDVYHYDPFRRRAARVHTDTPPGAGATTTTDFYVQDGGRIVARIDASNDVEDAFLFGPDGQPLRLARQGTSYFYEVDLAGNVRRLRDASGADLGGYRYTAFGQTFAADGETPAPAIDQPLEYKGRWFDGAAGGVYDMGARWWSPAMAAFLQMQPPARHDAASTPWGWPGQNPEVDRASRIDPRPAPPEAVGLLPEVSFASAFGGASTTDALAAVARWAMKGGGGLEAADGDVRGP